LFFSPNIDGVIESHNSALINLYGNVLRESRGRGTTCGIWMQTVVKSLKNGSSINVLLTGFYCLGTGLLRNCGFRDSRKLFGQLHRCQ